MALPVTVPVPRDNAWAELGLIHAGLMPSVLTNYYYYYYYYYHYHYYYYYYYYYFSCPPF